MLNKQSLEVRVELDSYPAEHKEIQQLFLWFSGVVLVLQCNDVVSVTESTVAAYALFLFPPRVRWYMN